VTGIRTEIFSFGLEEDADMLTKPWNCGVFTTSAGETLGCTVGQYSGQTPLDRHLFRFLALFCSWSVL
jgi:hypothetical protein